MVNLIQGKCVDGGTGWVCCLCVCVVGGGRLQDMINTY